MSRKESFHQKRKFSHSKRKESVSSDMVSESESYCSYIPIKKEVSNYIIIEKKFYEKLIQYIQKTNSFNHQLKTKKNVNKSKKVEYFQSLIDTFSIISTKKQTNMPNEIEKEKIKNENKNINIDNNKNNITNDNKNTNTNNTTNLDNKNKVNENESNNVKVNPNTSMMSLFMNSQKEKAKEKEQISKLQLELAEMTKKHETEIENYKSIIKDFSNKIDILQKQIKNLNDINNKMIEKENINKHKIQIIFSYPKIQSTILSYLNIEEKFDLSKCNSFLYKNIYFRAVTEKVYQKYKTREKIFEKFENEDLASKLEIKENEILDLFNKYIKEQKVSGKEMRNEIVKSLVFLEKQVKIPLSNFKGPAPDKNMLNFGNNEPKKGKFFTKIFSAIKSEITEEIDNITKNELINKTNINYITFNPNEFLNIFEADKYFLETFKTDKSLNVKFEYETSNRIKDIINEFFNSHLPQPCYQNFIQKICETFCDLLFSAFLALNDIKNLQIIMYALYSRNMKDKLKIEELQSVIEDLQHFADSNRQIKEMLTKTKNELEFKYTNSMMTISQLNNVIIEKDREINNVKLNSKEKEEKYEKFKNDIIKEYKKIKDDFNFTKNQRDSLKNILNELKDFFVKVVSGELLN